MASNNVRTPFGTAGDINKTKYRIYNAMGEVSMAAYMGVHKS